MAPIRLGTGNGRSQAFGKPVEENRVFEWFAHHHDSPARVANLADRLAENGGLSQTASGMDHRMRLPVPNRVGEPRHGFVVRRQ